MYRLTMAGDLYREQTDRTFANGRANIRREAFLKTWSKPKDLQTRVYINFCPCFGVTNPSNICYIYIYIKSSGAGILCIKIFFIWYRSVVFSFDYSSRSFTILTSVNKKSLSWPFDIFRWRNDIVTWKVIYLAYVKASEENKSQSQKKNSFL